MPTSHELIDSQPQLDRLCDNLAGIPNDAIAVDTEFVRTQTYWPQLCIVQIALNGQQVAVDVLADFDTKHLRELLLERSELTIYHAAKQDMEALYSVYDQLPNAIFDTQVGAGLLGFQPQIGYAGLVGELLGIDVPKDQTRTDWSRRPLTDAQIKYALDDVAHLHEIFDIIGDRLRELGRYDWAIEDSNLMLDSSLYYIDPDAAWRRLSSIPYLPVAAQARARRLAAWREDRARRSDRPRQWILADKALLAVANDNPGDATALARIEGIPPAVARKQGRHIVEILLEANADLAADRLDLQQEPAPVPPDKAQVKRLSGIVRSAAEELGIAPETLATRKDVTGILAGRDDLRVLNGWRREIIGERLLEAAGSES
jgi:ribonuclease D